MLPKSSEPMPCLGKRLLGVFDALLHEIFVVEHRRAWAAEGRRGCAAVSLCDSACDFGDAFFGELLGLLVEHANSPLHRGRLWNRVAGVTGVECAAGNDKLAHGRNLAGENFLKSDMNMGGGGDGVDA